MTKLTPASSLSKRLLLLPSMCGRQAPAELEKVHFPKRACKLVIAKIKNKPQQLQNPSCKSTIHIIRKQTWVHHSLLQNAVFSFGNTERSRNISAATRIRFGRDSTLYLKRNYHYYWWLINSQSQYCFSSVLIGLLQVSHQLTWFWVDMLFLKLHEVRTLSPLEQKYAYILR